MMDISSYHGQSTWPCWVEKAGQKSLHFVFVQYLKPFKEKKTEVWKAQNKKTINLNQLQMFGIMPVYFYALEQILQNFKTTNYYISS